MTIFCFLVFTITSDESVESRLPPYLHTTYERLQVKPQTTLALGPILRRSAVPKNTKTSPQLSESSERQGMNTSPGLRIQPRAHRKQLTGLLQFKHPAFCKFQNQWLCVSPVVLQNNDQNRLLLFSRNLPTLITMLN